MSATHLRLTNPDEQWRPIPGYEGRYEASDLGRVRSLPRRTQSTRPRRVPGGILATSLSRKGYPRVELYGSDRRRTIEIHRLVLLAFVGPCPQGMEGCHNDGDPSNCRLSNLRWDTRRENNLDTVRHGHNRLAARTRCRKGHPFSPENTIRREGDGRRCRTCYNAYFREYRAARKQVAA